MYDKQLRKIRLLVELRMWDPGFHGDDALLDDNLSYEDVDDVITTGIIVEKQHDRRSLEPKYVIHGYTSDDRYIRVVVRINSVKGLLLLLTAYDLDKENGYAL